MNKYNNHKIVTTDGVFDSKREFRRWMDLKDCQEAGEIQNLRRQVTFELIPNQYSEDRKLIERATKYIADFVYTKDGKTVIEDAKGKRTPEYIIKRKLLLQKFGLRILEV